jgi:hypothetical protein
MLELTLDTTRATVLQGVVVLNIIKQSLATILPKKRKITI